MPLQAIPGLDAVQNRRNNPYAGWPLRDGPESNRVEPLCQPAFDSSFKINYEDKIYTIGSCFARNIENVLIQRGFTVVTSKIPSDDPAFEKLGTELLNNYGVTSILNEFEWALDPNRPFDPHNNTYEAAPGRFVDMHLVPSIRAAPLDAVLARREAIISVTRKIVDCRIVIITLGLSEVWFDTHTSTYFNYAVPRGALNKSPERYELHVLSYEETIGCLHRIMALLKRHCRDDQRVLLTVSPVPLTATHTTQDVIVANSYSKSALRAAAGAIATEYPNVDYFPSYESVIYSDRLRAWKNDQAHVQSEIVELNVNRMIASYTLLPNGAAKTGEQSSGQAEDNLAEGEAAMQAKQERDELRNRFRGERQDLATAKTLFREGNAEAALALTDGLLKSSLRMPALHVRAGAYIKLGRLGEAEDIGRELVNSNTEDPAAHGFLARVLTYQKKYDEAIPLVERAVSLAPQAANWAHQLATLLIYDDRLEYAARVVDRALAACPGDVRLTQLSQRIKTMTGKSPAASDAEPAASGAPVYEARPATEEYDGMTDMDPAIIGDGLDLTRSSHSQAPGKKRGLEGGLMGFVQSLAGWRAGR